MNTSFIYKLRTLRTFVPALAMLLVLGTSCSDDDDNPGGAGTAENVNRNSTVRGEEMQRIEVPALTQAINQEIIIKRTDDYGVNFIIEWDGDKRAQRWTAWEWTASNTVQTWQRSNWSNTTWQGRTWRGDPFQEDPDIRIASQRSTLSDYSGSSYDRGHICASQDRIMNQDANGQTFYLSNMHPQVNGFNAGVWATMEEQARKWNTNEFRDTLWVVKGGTIDDVTINGIQQTGVLGTIGTNAIPIPKYFFMAFVCKKDGNYKALAFWIEHKASNDKSLAKYVISIDELEERTGIDFFCNLPDRIENAVEQLNSATAWGLQ